MKKTYITPAMRVDNAEPTNAICNIIVVSTEGGDLGFDSDGGLNEDAHAPKSAWDIWGED